MLLSDNESESKRTAHCPVCDRIVERRSRGRQRRFCSDDCRIRAHRISLQDAHKLVPDDAGAAPEDFDEPAAISSISLQAKSMAYGMPSRGIIGPRAVIRAAIMQGRKWTEIVSSGGVSGYVATLRPSALVR
jgi:endogenous inhibitor of DNA gyrase (YacG/DUF329 family)